MPKERKEGYIVLIGQKTSKSKPRVYKTSPRLKDAEKAAEAFKKKNPRRLCAIVHAKRVRYYPNE